MHRELKRVRAHEEVLSRTCPFRGGETSVVGLGWDVGVLGESHDISACDTHVSPQSTRRASASVFKSGNVILSTMPLSTLLIAISQGKRSKRLYDATHSRCSLYPEFLHQDCLPAWVFAGLRGGCVEAFPHLKRGFRGLGDPSTAPRHRAF
jgi:hypothetical protein